MKSKKKSYIKIIKKKMNFIPIFCYFLYLFFMIFFIFFGKGICLGLIQNAHRPKLDLISKKNLFYKKLKKNTFHWYILTFFSNFNLRKSFLQENNQFCLGLIQLLIGTKIKKITFPYLQGNNPLCICQLPKLGNWQMYNT